MSVGFAMLVHTALGRAAEVARHWAKSGCPVVIHADRRVARAEFEGFRAALSDLDNVSFCARHRCEWGTWSLVAASQEASRQLLARHPEVGHVYLASGSCLPLRPADELATYLAERPETDFIESVTLADVPWTIGGLDEERFTLSFPFSWKRQRFLFDRWVAAQRALGIKRQVPFGMVPHLGSQWWCLTRRTLTAILEDPDRAEIDRYFRRVWIPDESYYQTLVRRYGRQIESRSLTLSKFDFQGKPHIFYDDHLQLLRRSDCFVARKIWPHADKLYRSFLSDGAPRVRMGEPKPGMIDRVFARAVEQRTRGRPGLWMQSRFPNPGWENGFTCAPYSVFEGFSEVFEDFEPWLARLTGTQVHGHLYAQERAEFAGRQKQFAGGLSDSARIRDYNPCGFLTNLLWNTRGEHQCFQHGPADSQAASGLISSDPNARVWIVTGGWLVGLWRSKADFNAIRREAARLQRIEVEHLGLMRAASARARVRIWTLADFVANPGEILQEVLEATGPHHRRLTEVPRMHDLRGFSQFLQDLRNQGMQPHIVGDFPSEVAEPPEASPRRKPYLVR